MPRSRLLGGQGGGKEGLVIAAFSPTHGIHCCGKCCAASPKEQQAREGTQVKVPAGHRNTTLLALLLFKNGRAGADEQNSSILKNITFGGFSMKMRI